MNELTEKQIAAGAAVLGDNGKPIGRNTAIIVADAMSVARSGNENNAGIDLDRLKRYDPELRGMQGEEYATMDTNALGGYYKVEDVRELLARRASAAPSGKDAADEPAARVDRIISASGLAEVSVFLESALKVGRMFYAAAPVPQEAEQAGDIELIRIPAHDADSYCRILSIIGMEEEGDPVAEVQRLFDAAQEAEQAAPADGAVINEGAIPQPAATAAACARCGGEEVIWGGALQEGDSNYFDPCPDCQGFDPGDEIEHAQPAAPAVTNAARDVLADDRYLNDDCDAPMRNGACTECGFGPCRRTQSKE